MGQHLALLRAVNVAGHGRIDMEALRALFSASGGRHVTTYGHAGNVLFESADRAAASVLSRARKKLRRALGEEALVLHRLLRQLLHAIDSAPFGALGAGSDAKLYVAFLSRKPRRAPSFPLSFAKERLEATGMTQREVFVVSRPKASGFFGIPNAFVEDRLGVTATSRNWTTVTRLAALMRRRAEG